MLEPGQLIGNYRVVKLLGKGGMGAVFEAVHQYIGRRAAIKILHKDLSHNPNFVSRFLNEARAVNLVQHPGLVEIFEFGLLPDGMAYLIMEFLEGQSIDERMKGAGGRLVLEAPQLARQIAVALQAAHDKDIVHRDLKPQNVMIVPDREHVGQWRIKVVDFGIAKMAMDADSASPMGGFEKTGTGIAMGTPMYMSPEQCIGAAAAGSKSDVYSLGVMLYEMLSGRLPFHSDLRVELMTMHVRAQPRPLRDVAPEVPPDMADLVHRMLAKKPEERPTMGEVAEQLLHLGAKPSSMLFSLPPRTPAVDPMGATIGSMSGESSERPGLRRKGLFAALLALVVLLGGAGGLWHALSERGVPAHRQPPPVQRPAPQPPAPQQVQAAQVPKPPEVPPVPLGSAAPPPDRPERKEPRSKRHGQRGRGKSPDVTSAPPGTGSVLKHVDFNAMPDGAPKRSH